MVFNENTNYDFILLSKQGRTQLIYSTELTTEHVCENFWGDFPVAIPLIAGSASKTCEHHLETRAAKVWDLVQTECIISDHRAVAVSIQCSTFVNVWTRWWSPSQIELTDLRLRPRKEKTTTIKAKTYLINCKWPQRLGTVKTLIVQMRNISNRKFVCRADQCSACCCILCN